MPDHGIDPVQTVAHRVSELRNRKGMTAAEVGQRMKEQGFKWDRFTVANLEKGKRQNVTLTEWLGLAQVLDVSPLHLLVPLEEVEYRVTPETVAPAARVRAWVRGLEPLPGTDQRIFYTEVPLNEVQRREAKRELFERMGEWGAVDVEAEKRRDPGTWEGKDGEQEHREEAER